MRPAFQPRYRLPSCMRALRGTLRVNPQRLRLIFVVAVDTVLAILSLFLLDAHLAFFALLATVAHASSPLQCTPARHGGTRSARVRGPDYAELTQNIVDGPATVP